MSLHTLHKEKIAKVNKIQSKSLSVDEHTQSKTIKTMIPASSKTNECYILVAIGAVAPVPASHT